MVAWNIFPYQYLIYIIVYIFLGIRKSMSSISSLHGKKNPSTVTPQPDIFPTRAAEKSNYRTGAHT